MITADRLHTLISLGPKALAALLDSSGYKECTFKSVKFLGMTNGGQFCYSGIYVGDNGTDETTKVFLTYDSETDRVVADY